VFDEMERGLRDRAGIGDAEVTVRRSFDGRLYGQTWETPFVEVPPGPIDTPQLVERFHAAYERRYGNRFPYIPVQGVSYRVEIVVPTEKIEFTAQEGDGAAPQGAPTVEIRYFDDEPIAAAEYDREALSVGAKVLGPAVIREGLSTTLVCRGQAAEVGAFRELVIERC
jgi:N-methylhydantoinase A